MELTVNLDKNSYPIYIENGILARAEKYISKCFSGKKIMVISDDNVFPPVRRISHLLSERLRV